MKIDVVARKKFKPAHSIPLTQRATAINPGFIFNNHLIFSVTALILLNGFMF